MRKVILYIAQSLDGFIACSESKPDFLYEFDQDGDTSYDELIQKIDTVVMGSKTYLQIINELSPDKWVYEGKKSYVFTSQNLVADENVKFVRGDVCEFIEKIKKEDGKDIWICGGANIVKPLVDSNLIDEYQISTAPVLLGDGVRLFDVDSKLKLNFKKCEQHGQFAASFYEKI